VKRGSERGRPTAATRRARTSSRWREDVDGVGDGVDGSAMASTGSAMASTQWREDVDGVHGHRRRHGGRHRRDRPTTSVRSAMALTRWREDVDGVRRRRGRDEESPSTRCPQCVDARAKRRLPAVRCRRRYGWETSTERTEVEDAAARSLSRGGVQTSHSAKMTSVRSCSPPSASALARAKSASLFPRSRTCERWSVEFYE